MTFPQKGIDKDSLSDTIPKAVNILIFVGGNIQSIAMPSLYWVIFGIFLYYSHTVLSLLTLSIM